MSEGASHKVTEFISVLIPCFQKGSQAPPCGRLLNHSVAVKNMSYKSVFEIFW